jgi:hypothetical protein
MDYLNLPDDAILSWLLESDPWTSFVTRTELLGEQLSVIERNASVSKIIADAHVSCVLGEVREYFPYVAKSHTDAKLTHYKLRMLSDFGLKTNDGLQDAVEAVKARRDGALYAIRQRLPIPGADSGEWNALPCDSPLLTYTLTQLGDNDDLLEKQTAYYKELWRDETGWFCHLPFVSGQFRREQIGCPMAGLQALEVFSLDGNLKESEAARNAFKTLTHHYESGRSLYYFGRGKRFFTFKYPFIWYNALYLADVLSRFEFAKNHPMTMQLSDWIKSGRADDGRYKATSVYLDYKDWDFGSKKDASPWITLLCYRIMKRLSRKMD